MPRLLAQLTLAAMTLTPAAAHALPPPTFFWGALAFAPDGKTVAASDGRDVHFWDMQSGKRLRTLAGSAVVSSIVFSPDGSTLAVGGFDKTVRLFDATTGKLRLQLDGHTHWVWSLAFSPDSKTLASGSFDKNLKLWDAATGRLRHTLTHPGEVQWVAFVPDGKSVVGVSSGEEPVAQLWDVETGKPTRSFQGLNTLRQVAFSPDGKRLAGSGGDTVVIWDIQTGKAVSKFGQFGSPSGACFTPDGRTLAVGGGSVGVALWDVLTAQKRRTIDVAGHINSAAFAPDGKTLAVAAWNGAPSGRAWELVVTLHDLEKPGAERVLRK